MTVCTAGRVAAAGDWHAAVNKLQSSLGDRFLYGRPIAEPCFTKDGLVNVSSCFDSDACRAVSSGYLNESFRSDSPGGYINTQWEICQSSGQQCLLDYTNPRNIAAVSPPFQCQTGSVSPFVANVTSVEDIANALHISVVTNLTLVVKNTGHDYKGRSSAPGSLAVWTHNLKNIEHNVAYIPAGCDASFPAVTIGAGVQFREIYAYAEEHNFTFVGGSDPGVGASGGWVMGGGHGALSNTMGLGVDRVLEFKVVTPDGQQRIVSACQNEDLFFALRGGGGGTFSIVYESTFLISPPVTLQVAGVIFSAPNASLTKPLWSTVINNSLRWTQEGWGSFVTSDSALFVNPVIGPAAANNSMKPLLEFGQNLKDDGNQAIEVVFTEFSSWGSFFNTFDGTDSAALGVSLALASRLIPQANFETPDSRQELLNALLTAETMTPGLRMLGSTPFNFPGDGKTSVTDAWRNSIYHVTLIAPWNYNATFEEKKGQYDLASRSIDNLRKITPDAAYSNEADVHEPNHEVAFWGKHYDDLLEVKIKYDPDGVLDCWQCVGWTPGKAMYKCYI